MGPTKSLLPIFNIKTKKILVLFGDLRRLFRDLRREQGCDTLRGKKEAVRIFVGDQVVEKRT